MYYTYTHMHTHICNLLEGLRNLSLYDVMYVYIGRHVVLLTVMHLSVYTQLQSEELRQLLKHNEGVIDIQNKKMEEMEKELCDATSKPKTRRSPGTLRHNSSPGM